MFYYLVGLLDNISYKRIESLQKTLSNKFNLYNELPVLHLTLEIIENPDIAKLNDELSILYKKN